MRISVELCAVFAANGEPALLLALDVDLAELLFEFHDVLVKSVQQQLCVLGRHHDARHHFCLGHARQDAREIHDKFCGRVRDNGEVGIDAFRLFFTEFDTYLLTLILLLRLSCFFVPVR
jgi:hypothetical protein